jgi:hypothetical protein
LEIRNLFADHLARVNLGAFLAAQMHVQVLCSAAVLVAASIGNLERFFDGVYQNTLIDVLLACQCGDSIHQINFLVVHA